MFNDRERIWNLLIQWCLKHIYRVGGVHQDTLYRIMEKTPRVLIKATVGEMEKSYNGVGWK